MTKATLICDIEVYPNFFLIGFKRTSDGLKRFFELSERAEFDRDLVRRIMHENRIVTFNGEGFDVPLIWYVLNGATYQQAKVMCDRIINGGVRKWDVQALLEVRVPREVDHVDLIEPQPNAFASLKTLAGRLHAPRMQDLPYPPDKVLTHEQMNLVTQYCGNDLDNTHLLLDALAEPLALREAMGAQYGIDLRSKSDAQMGEAMIRKRVEQLTGRRVEKVETPAGTTFPFKVPEWMQVEHPDLRRILDRLREAEFTVRYDGKVSGPAWLDDCSLSIGETTYAMGIGGLHSTEQNRAVVSDDGYVLLDFDVASYYPAIILNSGLYPRSLGPEFLEVFRQIRDERVSAKRRVQEIDAIDKPGGLTPELVAERDRLREQIASIEAAAEAVIAKLKQRIAEIDAIEAAGGLTPALKAERAACVAAEKGLKIALNGCFGKLGSVWSILYAPHLLIAITLGGQMALLMLIDRAERAGIQAVSANTDGVVFRCPRELAGPVVKGRLTGGPLRQIVEQWEADTGFELEATEYSGLYSESVNSYLAIKPDGKVKAKGPGWTGRHEGDMRTQLMKNPQMEIVTIACWKLIAYGTPLEKTIRECRDIRDFVTTVNVKGGGTWRGEFLGKVVRYIWSTDGDEILYKDPHPTTGNFKKVSKTDGCRPLMELPDTFPADLDYARYVEAAQERLVKLGYREAPPVFKKLRVLKRERYEWLALSLAA